MKALKKAAFTRVEIGLCLLIAALSAVVTAVLVSSEQDKAAAAVIPPLDEAGETIIDLEYEVDERGVSLAPVKSAKTSRLGKAPAKPLISTNAGPAKAAAPKVQDKVLVKPKAGESLKGKATIAKPDDKKLGAQKKPEKAGKQQEGKDKGAVINIPPAVAELLEEIEEAEWSRATEVKLLNVVRDWGRKHPEDALEYALSIERKGTRNSAVGGILGSWAKDDPDAAYDWLKSEAAVDPYNLEGQTRSIFNILSSKNVSDALSKVWDLPSEAMKRQALGTVAGRMISLGREQDVLSLYNQLDSAADKKLVYDVVLQSMGRYEPTYLGEWVLSMQDKGARSKGLDVLMSVWANDHPRSAAEWVTSELESESDRARQMARVAGAWAKEDPAQAADWLLSLFPPSSQTDAAVGAFARAVMPESPGYAGTWSFAVTKEDQRWKLMEEIGAAWLKKDRAKAVEFIHSTDLPKDTKNRLLK